MYKIKLLLKNIYVLIFLFLIFFSLVFLIVLNKRAMPIIINYANVQTKRIGIEILRNAVIKEVNELLKDKDLFKITKNNNGEIESIDFDTGIINESLLVVAKNVRKRLKEVEKGEAELTETVAVGKQLADCFLLCRHGIDPPKNTAILPLRQRYRGTAPLPVRFLRVSRTCYAFLAAF